MNDLIVKDKYEVSTPPDFPTMLSRIGNNLPSLSDKAVAKIQERMPEIHRASKAFGRSNSPAENKLMTLTLIAGSPYKRLKQCLAEIEKKRNALKEAYFRQAKNENKLAKLEYKLRREEDEFKQRDIEIKIMELQVNMADQKIYIEGALKSIGDFQDSYEQIRKAHNIPKNWDEKDFIEAEYEHHIKTAFQHAYRDLQVTGGANHGTLEYFEQYGIDPVVGYNEVKNYLQKNNHQDIESLYAWYDRMYEKYKDCPKKAMKRIGLDEIYNDDFIYIEK